MSTDYEIGLKIDGAEADQKLQALIHKQNQAQQAAERVRHAEQRRVAAQREIVSLARKEREEAFAKLPVEEKINKLMERREQIARRINQAEGNATRQAQLKLAQRRNDAALRDAQTEQADGSLGAYFLGGLASRIPGAERLKGLFGKLPGTMAGRVGLGAAGGLAAGAWLGMSRAIGTAGGLVDLTGRTDLNAQSLQRLAYVASTKGGRLDQYIGSIEDAKRARAKAVTLGGDDLRSLQALGFTLEELIKSDAEQIFFKISAGIKAGAIGADQYNALLQVLGPQSRELFSAMKKGAAEAAAEFDRLNLALSDEMVGKLAAIGTWWKEMGGRAGATGKSWGMKVAGFGVDMANALGAGIAGLLGMKDVQKIMLHGDPNATTPKAAGAKPAIVKTAEELAAIEKVREQNAKAILAAMWEELSAEEQIVAAKQKVLDLEKALKAEKDEMRREQLVAELIQARRAARNEGSMSAIYRPEGTAALGLIRESALNLVSATIASRTSQEVAILRRIEGKLDMAVRGFSGGPV